MRYLILAATAMCLAGCVTNTPPDPATGPVTPYNPPNTRPTTPGDATTLDERAGIIATEAYTAASKRGQELVEQGQLDKEAFKAADRRGFTAVKLLRHAYEAGNATSYAAAVWAATRAAADINALINGG